MTEPNEIRCDTLGEGRPILVCSWGPGGYGTLYRWALQPLAKHAQLHFWDYRGCGRSSPAERYSVRDDMWDLASLIQGLELKKPIILGHSYGGMVALSLATEYPELVGGLALINTMPDFSELKEARNRAKKTMSIKSFVQWENLGIKCIDGKASDQEKLEYLKIEAGHLVHDDKHVKHVLQHLRVDFEVLARMQDSLQVYDVTRELKNISVPALVTTGSHDQIAAEAPKRIHLALQNSHFVRFGNSGHIPFLEEPKKFHDTMVEWLAGVP